MTNCNADQPDRHDAAEFNRHDELRSKTECCKSGCTVCVLDYPDAFPIQDATVDSTIGLKSLSSSSTPSSDDVDHQLLAMLEAFERAEAIVAALAENKPESVLPSEGDN